MNRKNGMLLCLLMGVVLAFAAQEARSEILIRRPDFGDGADAYVRGGPSVVNFGTAPALITRNQTGGASSPVTHSFSIPSLSDSIRHDDSSLVTIALRRLDSTQGILELASKENLGSYDSPSLTIAAPGIPEPSAFHMGLFSVLLLSYGVRSAIRKTTPIT